MVKRFVAKNGDIIVRTRKIASGQRLLAVAKTLKPVEVRQKLVYYRGRLAPVDDDGKPAERPVMAAQKRGNLGPCSPKRKKLKRI